MRIDKDNKVTKTIRGKYRSRALNITRRSQRQTRRLVKWTSLTLNKRAPKSTHYLFLETNKLKIREVG